MRSFAQFVESKEDKGTSHRNAIMALAGAIQDVFKKYNTNVRKDAWKKITGKKGESLIQNLLRNPSHSISGFRTLP